MKKKGLIFAVFFFAVCLTSFPSKADVEALEPIITTIMDLVEQAKEKILKAKGLLLKKDELMANADKYNEKVKEGKKKFANPKEKASGMKGDALGKAKGFLGGKNKRKNNNESTEFASLDKTFDGSKDDDEMSEDINNTYVRKQGADSISSQNELSANTNRKIGLDCADMYGKALVLRLDLQAEKDEFELPESVDKATKLYEDVKIRSMKRQNSILEMEGGLGRVEHTRALETQDGAQKTEAENE